ncbi:MAG TPA: hypothetical protein VND93_18530 [Myxococcales bacterium]|nr:hypothetical protein [Myxococcales bacterium]
MKQRFRYELVSRPGLRWSEAERRSRVAELREVGAVCLQPLPEYQLFLGTRDELSDKLLIEARGADGSLAGFCSAVLLEVSGVGEVLHLGLTCVRPEARGTALTHALSSRLVLRYLLQRLPRQRVYVTNVANVLSSLGNFAVNLTGAFPSPFFEGPVPEAYLEIARAFDRQYRAKAHVQSHARWDEAAFVFRGSGRGTAFQKDGDDARYHHRDPELNRFYRQRLRFEDGDEMLQVGTISLLDLARYFVRGWGRGRRRTPGPS